MTGLLSRGRPRSKGRGIWRATRGAAAIEFAIVALPFLTLLIAIMQVGVYYVTQWALDSGVTTTAEGLRNSFTSAAPVFPSAGTLKSTVVANAGAMISNDSSLAVDIRPLTALDGSAVPITDGTASYGTTTSVLVLRAQSTVVVFAPGLGSLETVTSAAIVRRQGT